MKLKTAIAVFVLIFSSLAYFGLTSNKHNNALDQRLAVTCVEMYFLKVDGISDQLQSPEMKREIEAINAQIPRVQTVAHWNAAEADRVAAIVVAKK